MRSAHLLFSSPGIVVRSLTRPGLRDSVAVRAFTTKILKKHMAKKSDRSDPKSNKSLAIRNVLKKMPNAKASEVAAAVKKEYGHTVGINIIYMVKTKLNMASARKKTGTAKTKANSSTPMTSAALWVDAIKS